MLTMHRMVFAVRMIAPFIAQWVICLSPRLSLSHWRW